MRNFWPIRMGWRHSCFTILLILLPALGTLTTAWITSIYAVILDIVMIGI